MSMEWERVNDSGTERLKVDGGYIYKEQKGSGGLAMVFVPDVDLQRYQAHLRDAYNQGYKHGHEDGINGFTKPDDVTLTGTL
jgi:hypothetical protein